MTVRQSFNLKRSSVGASRKFVGEAVADLPVELQEAVVLMVSELATNAIVHAVTGFEVCIDRKGSKLRVEVTDLGGGRPELRAPSSDDPHGRGLQIVKTLSDKWGIVEMTSEKGKTVWFTVTLQPTEEREGDHGTKRLKRSRADGYAGRATRRTVKERGDHRPDGDRPKDSNRTDPTNQATVRGAHRSCRQRSCPHRIRIPRSLIS